MSQTLRQRAELREVTRIGKEPKTLLEGRKWIPASDHSDPQKFRERMKEYAARMQKSGGMSTKS